jgi:hypothetical protein
MKEITVWEERALGDLGFYVGTGIEAEVIQHAEKFGDKAYLGPILASKKAIPTHTIIFGPPGQVYESIESGPTLTPDESYHQTFLDGRLYILRPPGDEDSKQKAYQTTVSKYEGRGYGWFKCILGFIFIFPLRRLGNGDYRVPNPFLLGVICSELGLYYLRALSVNLYQKISIKMYKYVPRFLQTKKLKLRLSNPLPPEPYELLQWPKLLPHGSTDPCLLLSCSLTDGSILQGH